MKLNLFYLYVLSLFVLAGCSSSTGPKPPKNQDDICSIFRQYPEWYKATFEMRQKWGTPIPVSMAIMRQESSFRYNARPPKKNDDGSLVPDVWASTAYGYAQALDMTWTDYLQSEAERNAKRTKFDDSMMFIGWYTNNTYNKLGVSKWDAYNQYLAYHEGAGGYQRGSHKQKTFLLKAALNVKDTATNYTSQLNECRAELDKERRGW